MKERPKTGDRVKFRRYRAIQTGRVVAVAQTGVHFLIEASIGYKKKLRRIGLSAILQILPSIG